VVWICIDNMVKKKASINQIDISNCIVRVLWIWNL